VAVLSATEITYFAVNLSKPWAKYGKDGEICPTFLQIQNRVASVLEGALGETVKKHTALVITDAVIAQAAPMASLDSSGTLAPSHDTPPPHSSPTPSLRSTSLHRRPQAVGRSSEGFFYKYSAKSFLRSVLGKTAKKASSQESSFPSTPLAIQLKSFRF
jgi:hypothetical protein